MMRRAPLFATVIAAAALLIPVPEAHATIDNGRPDAVWGRPDLTSRGCDPGRVTATRLCRPAQAVVDSHGNLWVADRYNSRVLMYPFDPVRGRPSHIAHKVLGQYNDLGTGGCNRPTPGSSSPPVPSQYTLCMPSGLAFDSQGALYVADQLNNRVLVYFHPSNLSARHRSDAADLVLGQGDFSSNGANGTPAGGSGSLACEAPDPASACTLYSPEGLSIDARDNLLVADTLNNRVLMWSAETLALARKRGCAVSCYIPATRVWGQHGSFTTACPNQPADSVGRCAPSSQAPAPSASTLDGPQAAVADAQGDLFVADGANNRVLEYDDGIDTNRQEATLVYGQQGRFDTAGVNVGGVSASSLAAPAGLALDPHGNLWVSDQGNSRVLEFPVPDSASVASDIAIHVLGQNGSLTRNTADGDGIANSLTRPCGLAFDRAGDAYVADDDRVLEYRGLF